ncbi:MAG: DNA internalization-related competence protein ComEC/Rec2 [Gammaproteobacteria bacterium]|nr:DNA internalization-related competence protein ComEC/Rec2 [Gammaproteobacteria bacterium]
MDAVSSGSAKADAPRWRITVGISVLLWLYALSLGAVALLPKLPQFDHFLYFSAACLSFYLLCFLFVKRFFLNGRGILIAFCYPLLAISLGFGWGLWSNHQALAKRLPLTSHGMDFPLQVEVISLPGVRPGTFLSHTAEPQQTFNLRFTARVIRSDFPPLQQQKLNLTWYQANAEQKAALAAGSQWQMTLRLKRPRGNANPHTLDYEAWLLQQGVYASGYVRPKVAPRLIRAASPGLLSLRQYLRELIDGAKLHNPHLVSALLLGDKSGVDKQITSLLRTTGTAHLLAISGLHVGMVATFMLLLGQLLSRLMGLWALWPVRNPLLLPGVCALLGALTYTLIAGAPLSAQRALVMSATLLLAWIWRRRLGAGLAYVLALAVVLSVQPLALHNPGFWLSFAAVAALLLRFNGRSSVFWHRQFGSAADSGHTGPVFTGLDWLVTMVRSQWVVVLALFLPSLIFFSGFSLGGLLLNLIAIPWLGFILLPTLLLGMVCLLVGWQPWLLAFADWQLSGLIHFLAAGESFLPSWQLMTPPGPVVLLLTTISVVILLLPRGLPGRSLGWSLLAPLMIAAGVLPLQLPAQLKLSVLDVGQGLALIVQTPKQRLLYDTGPDSPSGWSSGSQIIAPYLLGQGVRQLDTVIVSHGDRDHAGGLLGLAELLGLKQLYAPGQLAQKLRQQLHIPTAPCDAPGLVELGDLRLSWLWPPQHAEIKLSGEENDHSCVALVQWRHLRLLLSGDISRTVEQQLVQRYPNFTPVDLLIAPHHGSKSSSSAPLIRWAKPARVVFSAGFRHHFGHPHPAVVGRYRAAGSELFNTAERGALEFIWRAEAEVGAPPRITAARDAPRFWYVTDGDDSVYGNVNRAE